MLSCSKNRGKNQFVLQMAKREGLAIAVAIEVQTFLVDSTLKICPMHAFHMSIFKLRLTGTVNSVYGAYHAPVF